MGDGGGEEGGMPGCGGWKQRLYVACNLVDDTVGFGICIAAEWGPGGGWDGVAAPSR